MQIVLPIVPMSFTQASHLRRYRDIAGLLWRQRHRARRKPTGVVGANPHAADGDGEVAEATRLAEDLESMGATFVKLGQVLSTRPDLMPMPYVKALSRLQDHVAPFDAAEARHIIEAELGVRVSKAFSEFSDKPLAAASLGQVHRAALRDGRQVVIKVQRPGVAAQVKNDLAALETVATMLDKHTKAGRTYEFALMLEEFKASLLRELDYQQEARNLDWLADALKSFPNIVVPRPVADFTSERVLTMEYIAGTKVTALSGVVQLDIDGPALAEDLFRAYLQQILVDGMFHADPHPGNVLLTPDGKIALIDLGMVAYLSPSWRDGLLRLLLSLSEGRSDEVADLSIELSDAGPAVDERNFRRHVAQIVSRQQHASVDEVEVGTLVIEIAQAATVAGFRVPSELTMLGKTLLSLDQVGRVLSPEFRPNEAIRRHAGELMSARVKQQTSQAHLFQKALELNDLVQRTPTRVNRIVDALAHNRFKMVVDVIDEDIIVDGMQKVANRITTGLILAALIIGSAMMMRVETSFQIAGYPGFAILMFLAAATQGMWLVLDIVLKDRKVKK